MELEDPENPFMVQGFGAQPMPGADAYVAGDDNPDDIISLMATFKYDQHTGVFTRRIPPRVGVPISDKSSNGYIRIRHNNKSYGAHRVAWLMMTGKWPAEDVDHINCDRADNRWANLRSASRSDNLGNIGARVDNASGIKGAYFSKRLGKWQSFIQRHGKHKYLGLFPTAEAAHTAYMQAANENFGEFARGTWDNDRAGGFLQTYSGRKFWPADPRPDEVHIEDIAHSLSLQCRYAGHCRRFYSVAEHSVLIARWLLSSGPEIALHGLLHDATEAYLVDLPRPVKASFDAYKAMEAELYKKAIAPRFGLMAELPEIVHEADGRIIADELVNLRPMDWHAGHKDGLGVTLEYWSPDRAETEFLAMYVRLADALAGVPEMKDAA